MKNLSRTPYTFQVSLFEIFRQGQTRYPLANRRPTIRAAKAAIAPVKLNATMETKSMMNILITSMEEAMVIGFVFLLFISKALWREMSTVSPGSKVAIWAGNFAKIANPEESPDIL